MKPMTFALILVSGALGISAAFAQTTVPSDQVAESIADMEEVDTEGAGVLSEVSEAARPERSRGDPPDLVLTPAELQALGRVKPTAADPEAADRRAAPPLADSQDQDRSLLGGAEGPVRVSLLDTLMKLGVVVLLLYGCLYVYRGLAQRKRPAGGMGGGTLCILQSVPMGGSKALHVVEAGPRTLLIADSGSRLAILADLTPGGERSAITTPARARVVTSAGPRRAEALEWEEEHPARQQEPVDPSGEGSRADAPRRAAARRANASGEPSPANDLETIGSGTIRSRRALLLRALRSKEDARREPAVADSDRF